jgi:membrane protease YdiL (CAAX protease family)
MKRALLLSIATITLLVLLGLAIRGVWWRMAALYAVMIPVALLVAKVDWRALWRPRAWHLPAGLAAAFALYAAGWIVHRFVPADQVARLLAWKTEAPSALLAPLLVFVIVGEEIVWRCAITMSVGGKMGVVVGTVAFAIAHIAMGIPFLAVAALGAGFVWSALVVATKSAWPALVCHLAWDVTVLFVLPY